MVWGYHAAEPNSYLVITGAGVKGLKLTKKAMVYPFQKVAKISITPFHFTTDLQAMTSEKLQVCLPAVFTIGPKDEQESLIKYAGLMTDSTSDAGVASREHIQAIIMGIVEGETRSVVSNITMKELFEKRSLYRTKVVEHVQSDSVYTSTTPVSRSSAICLAPITSSTSLAKLMKAHNNQRK
jgi:flotillin